MNYELITIHKSLLEELYIMKIKIIRELLKEINYDKLK